MVCILIGGEVYEADVQRKRLVLRDCMSLPDVLVFEDSEVLEAGSVITPADAWELGVRLVRASKFEVAALVRGGYTIRWARPHPRRDS
jgi:hypothetical protein